MASVAQTLLFSTTNISKNVWFASLAQGCNTNLWLNALVAGTDTNQYGPFFPANTRRGKAHPDVVRAMALLSGNETSQFAVLKIGTEHYVAETILESGSSRITSISFSNGVISACETDLTGSRFLTAETIMSSREYDCTGFFLCMIHQMWDLASDPAHLLASAYLDKDTCLSYMPGGTHFSQASPDDAEKDMRNKLIQISSALQYGLENQTFRMTIPSDGNLNMLTKQSLDALSGAVLSGSPRFISQTSNSSDEESITFAQAKAKYKDFSARFNWSEEEKLLIPSFLDDFIVPKEALKIARWFVSTWDDIRPMKQFMWRGPTSYGKSTGIETLAAVLGMPLVRLTCHSDTELDEFLSRYVPVTDSDKSNQEIPDLTYDDISYDPEGAYNTLTGQEIDSITPEEVFVLYRDMLRGSAGNENKYKLVESNYMKALRHGYLVEVQEPSRIKDRGTLVGLNEYDRPGAIVPVIDGSYFRRSENTLVVFTDNTGYASCYPIDPSVIRRFDTIIDSFELPELMVKRRIEYNTGCKNSLLVDKLYDIWLSIQTYCKENEITEGSVSATELEHWLRLVMLDGDSSIRENCQVAVISKASSEEEEQAAIMAAVEALF